MSITLTEEQKRIMKHDPNKHACILAGPGTGKSFTIINYIKKVKEINEDKKVKLLTFTRAANSELTGKIEETGEIDVNSSTVHSFAISVLINNPGTSGLPEPIRITDDWEWNYLVKKDLSRLMKISTYQVEELKNEMSSSWESLEENRVLTLSNELKARFMGFWEEHRRIFGYSLLSELPFRLKTAIEGNTDLDFGDLNIIAVDEYQDLNACDLRCLKLISEKGITLIAIGDDDQSIYSFRKAHPEGIRRFTTDFQAVLYPLSISHRCGAEILDWANFVIGGDTSRASKPSLSPSQNSTSCSIGYYVFNRENKEVEGIARIIKWLIKNKDVPIEEILVLLRTSSIGRLIRKQLDKDGIKYLDPEEYLELPNNREVRKCISLVRLFANPDDSLAWWTLLLLTRGIGNNTIHSLYDLAKANKTTFGIYISKHSSESKEIQKISVKLKFTLKQVIELIGSVNIPENENWGKWIIERIGDGMLPKIPESFSSLLLKIDDEVNENISLNQYINQLEPNIKDVSNAKKEGKLRVMSLSRSKGLTATAVIIAGVEDGIIPHPSGDTQEERRLLYVGMTRARECLYLTRSRRRVGPTARSGKTNVAGIRKPCPFLVGGPVQEKNGDAELKKLGY